MRFILLCSPPRAFLIATCLLFLALVPSAHASTYVASGPEPKLVSVTRLNNPYTTDHTYSNNPAEVSALNSYFQLAIAGSTDPTVRALAYATESSLGYLYDAPRPTLTETTMNIVVSPLSPIPGTVVVYRMWNNTIKSHVLTANLAERSTLKTQGYVDDGTVGYIRLLGTPGTQPVYRLNKSSTADNIYTTSAAERTALITAGWTDKGILGYSMTSPTIPYYEFSAPSGAYAGKPPRGLMFEIHGGGLTVVGQTSVRTRAPNVQSWTNRGWMVLNVDYRVGRMQADGSLTSLADIEWFYDQARAWQGPSRKICATGDSAGALLSTWLATTRSSTLACAIPRAGLYDLPGMVDPTDPIPYLAPGVLTTFATIVFAPYGGGTYEQGLLNMSALSPINRIPQTGSVPILMSNATNDIIIPMSNPRAYCAARPAKTQLVTLHPPAPGTTGTPWVHSSVNSDELAGYYATEAAFGNAVLAGTWTNTCVVQ